MISLIDNIFKNSIHTIVQILDSDYLEMSELTKETGDIVSSSFNHGRENLTPFDIEHTLKITSDATNKIKSQTELIV